MNKSNATISVILAMLMITTPLSVITGIVSASETSPEVPAFAGGDGSIGNPWQIADVNDLQAMNQNLNDHYILINDINASETSTWNAGSGFLPVGYDEDLMAGGWQGGRFNGTFNGADYSITGLYINRPELDGVGLFGITDEESGASNTTFLNANITGGILVEKKHSLRVINCYDPLCCGDGFLPG